MRKIIFLMHMSLDGFVGRPDGNIDFVEAGGDIGADAYSLHPYTDTAIYGRNTFKIMDDYWPQALNDPETTDGERSHAQWYANITKYVISTTMADPEDEKIVVIRDNLKEEFAKIKAQPGKDIWLLGSPSVAQAMLQAKLVDEIRLNVNPVIIGAGIPLFANQEKQLNLKLIGTKNFESGVVQLRYIPVSE